jgi:flagellar protein FliS
MLYDGVIAALQRAVNAIEAGDIGQKCANLNRAQAIVAQLEGTLNFEAGGEVARTLKSLYVYSRAQILKANLENSAPVLRALIDRLSSVREAWYEADHQPSPAPQTPAVTDSSPQPPSPAPSALPAYRSGAVPADSNYGSSSAPEPGSWRVSA